MPPKKSPANAPVRAPLADGPSSQPLPSFGIVEDSARPRAVSISSCESDPLAYRHVGGCGSSRASSLSGHSSFFDDDDDGHNDDAASVGSAAGSDGGASSNGGGDGEASHSNAAPLSTLPGIRRAGSPAAHGGGTATLRSGAGVRPTRKRIDVEDADIEEFVLKRSGQGLTAIEGDGEAAAAETAEDDTFGGGPRMRPPSTSAALAKATLPTVVPAERVSPLPFATIESVIPRSATVVAAHTRDGHVVDCGAFACLKDGTVVGAISTLLGAVLSCRYAIVGDSGAFAELLMSGKAAEVTYNAAVTEKRRKRSEGAQQQQQAQAEGSDADVGSDVDSDDDSEAEEANHRSFLAYTPLAIGTHLYYDTEGAEVIYDPLAIAANQKEATDASFVNDDELPNNKRPDFSDDEKEREWKKEQRSRQQASRGGASSASSGGVKSAHGIIHRNDDDDDDTLLPLGHTTAHSSNNKNNSSNNNNADEDEDVSSSDSEAEFDEEGAMIAYKPKRRGKEGAARTRVVGDMLMGLIGPDAADKGAAASSSLFAAPQSEPTAASTASTPASAAATTAQQQQQQNQQQSSAALLTTPSGVPILKRGRGSVNSCAFGSQLVKVRDIPNLMTNTPLGLGGRGAGGSVNAREPPLILNSEGVVAGVSKRSVAAAAASAEGVTVGGKRGRDGSADANAAPQTSPLLSLVEDATAGVTAPEAIVGGAEKRPPRSEAASSNNNGARAPMSVMDASVTSAASASASVSASIPSIRIGGRILAVVPPPTNGVYSDDRTEFSLSTSSVGPVGSINRRNDERRGQQQQQMQQQQRGAVANNSRQQPQPYPLSAVTSPVSATPQQLSGGMASPHVPSPQQTPDASLSSPMLIQQQQHQQMLHYQCLQQQQQMAMAHHQQQQHLQAQLQAQGHVMSPQQQQEQMMMLSMQQQQQAAMLRAQQQQMVMMAQQQHQHQMMMMMSPQQQQQQQQMLMMQQQMALQQQQQMMQQQQQQQQPAAPLGVVVEAGANNLPVASPSPSNAMAGAAAASNVSPAMSSAAAAPAAPAAASSPASAMGSGPSSDPNVQHLLQSIAQQQQQMAMMAQQLQMLQGGAGGGAVPAMGGMSMGMAMPMVPAAPVSGSPQQPQQQQQQPSVPPQRQPTFSELAVLQQQANAQAHAQAQQHQQMMMQQQHQQQQMVGGMGMSLPTFPQSLVGMEGKDGHQ